MPKCPRDSCSIEWVWDWDLDSYRNKETGQTCEEREIYESIPGGDDNNEKYIQIILYICTCGKCMAVNVHDYDGASVFNDPSWKDVDWMKEENSYLPKYLRRTRRS